MVRGIGFGFEHGSGHDRPLLLAHRRRGNGNRHRCRCIHRKASRKGRIRGGGEPCLTDHRAIRSRRVADGPPPVHVIGFPHGPDVCRRCGTLLPRLHHARHPLQCGLRPERGRRGPATCRGCGQEIDGDAHCRRGPQHNPGSAAYLRPGPGTRRSGIGDHDIHIRIHDAGSFLVLVREDVSPHQLQGIQGEVGPDEGYPGRRSAEDGGGLLHLLPLDRPAYHTDTQAGRHVVGHVQRSVEFRQPRDRDISGRRSRIGASMLRRHRNKGCGEGKGCFLVHHLHLAGLHVAVGCGDLRFRRPVRHTAVDGRIVGALQGHVCLRSARVHAVHPVPRVD